MVVETISPAAKSGTAAAGLGEGLGDGVGVGAGVGLGEGDAVGAGVGVRGGGKVQAASIIARTRQSGPPSFPTGSG
jgi:hypothetical protein